MICQIHELYVVHANNDYLLSKHLSHLVVIFFTCSLVRLYKMYSTAFAAV